MEMTAIHGSSHMRAAGYDPAAQVMHIQFHNGTTYEYPVHEQMHRDMMNADSQGAFFHAYIRPHHIGKRVH
jgi:hypothetical protein